MSARVRSDYSTRATMTTEPLYLQAKIVGLEAPSMASVADGTASREFEMEAYSGGTFDVGFGLAVIDLDGMELPKTLPILRQHNFELFIGRGAPIVNDGQSLSVKGSLFDDADANRVASLSDQGAEWQASVGITWDWDAVDLIAEKSSADVNGQTFDGPILVLRQATLKEASFVPLGADPNTSATALRARLADRFSSPVMEAVVPDPINPVDLLAQEKARTTALAAAWLDKNPAFVVEATSKGWSLDQAKLEWGERIEAKLSADLAAKDAELAEQAAKLAEAERKAGLASPASQLGMPGADSAASDDPIELWHASLAAEVERLKMHSDGFTADRGSLTVGRNANLRAKAVANLSLSQPDLRAAYVETYNARGLGRRRQGS